MFDNKGLRRIFEPKREEVRGKFGKLHNVNSKKNTHIFMIIKLRRR
jgi:hypothetical protein